VAVTFRTAIGALGASVTAWPCSCDTASGRDGGNRLRPVPGQPCAAARRAVGLPPEGRGESCRPQRRDPGDPSRLSPVPLPLVRRRCRWPRRAVFASLTMSIGVIRRVRETRGDGRRHRGHEEMAAALPVDLLAVTSGKAA